MIYPYECASCKHEFEVTKSVRFIDDIESCPICFFPNNKSSRKLAKSGFFYGASVDEAVYNPGLGMVIKNRKHKAEVLRQKGLVEIGNENIDKIHSSFEKEREKKFNDRYDEISKPIEIRSGE